MDLAEYKPKSSTVMVGEMELVVQEFVLAKRDAVFAVFFRGVDVMLLVRPFLEAAKASEDGQKKVSEDGQKMVVDLEEIAKQIVSIAVRVLSRDLTTIACLALDVPRNRQTLAERLHVASFGKELQEDADHLYYYSPEMHQWIRENLTLRQEQRVVEALVEVNDFASLIKKYSTLAVKIRETAREKASPGA